MAAGAARRPAGKVSEVFESDADRQGAYDALEDRRITPEALTAAAVAATVDRCRAHRLVFVAVDGSSLAFTDGAKAKGLGAIGPASKGGRGLKVMTAYALDVRGVPLGVTAQSWWARTGPPAPDATAKRRSNAKRPTRDKETQRWLDVIDGTKEALAGGSTRAWFQLDREGDSAPVLQSLVESGHRFTVRSSANRRLAGARATYLRQRLGREKVLGTYALAVSAGPNRTARTARLSVRTAKVELRFRHPWTKKVTHLAVSAVLVQEVSRTPAGENPIDWLLLTNVNVSSFDDALTVIRGYAARWRIEEFHKTWKSGGCHVEDAQLRSLQALIKWATILGAVTTRIERLKQLARTNPELPASEELQPSELRALLVLKRKQKKKTEVVGDEPTIGEAVRWLADLGGYTGKSSGGPPGAITIGRGLHDVLVVAAALDGYDEQQRRRKRDQ